MKSKINNAEHIKPENKAVDMLATGVAVYALGRAAMDVVREKRAQVKQSKTPPALQPSPPRELTPQREAPVNREKNAAAVRRFESTLGYFNEYLSTPMSLLKMISRADMYHSPWAYHKPPKWSALHLDQTDAITKAGGDPGDYKYTRSIDALSAYGRTTINKGVLRRMREGGRSTILYDHQTADRARQEVGSAPESSKASVAGRRGAEVSNVVATMIGLGFHTDLEFARWERGGETYQLVPFVQENQLHRMAAYDIDLPKTPGLLLRTRMGTTGHPEDTSVAVDVVDIHRAQREWAEMGVSIPTAIPDPKLLAAQEYIGPGVLPSTQGESYTVSRAI